MATAELSNFKVARAYRPLYQEAPPVGITGLQTICHMDPHPLLHCIPAPYFTTIHTHVEALPRHCNDTAQMLPSLLHRVPAQMS